ncbi:MAG: hypothetical protein IT170_01130 [Bryobacterales bacterium]|nr:hypothetical protein [Bryobacterales bacterium]
MNDATFSKRLHPLFQTVILLAALASCLAVTARTQNCTYTIPSQPVFPSGAAYPTIPVSTSPECPWAVQSLADWISVSNATGSPGAGAFTLLLQPNYGSTARTGQLIVGTVAISIQQETGGRCAPTILRSHIPFPAEGGTERANIYIPNGCSYAASITGTTSPSWVQFQSGQSGVASGFALLVVAKNPTTADRSATLVVQTSSGRAEVPIAQEASTCTASISPVSWEFNPTANEGYIDVTTLAGCSWTAVASEDWITILEPVGGSVSGNGRVRFRVSENEAPHSRVGKILVAGRTFSVEQRPAQKPTIYVSSAGFSITARLGRNPPAPFRGLSVLSGSEESLAFGITQDLPGWLSVVPDQSQTPAVLAISVNLDNLPIGSYTHNVELKPVDPDRPSAYLLISLRLELPVFNTFAPRALTFRIQDGKESPDPQAIFIIDNPEIQEIAGAAHAGVPLDFETTMMDPGRRITVKLRPGTQISASRTLPFNVACPDFGCVTESVPVQVEVLPAGHTGPRVGSGGVVNAASFLQGGAVGAWVSIFGENLAPATRIWDISDFQGNKMPTSLDGVSVTVRGVPAPVQFISPGQVNIQIPDGTLSSNSGNWVDLTLSTPTGSDTTKVYIFREAPGLFAFANGTDIAAVHPDGVIVAAPDTFPGVVSRPALPGDIVSLYGTGFGPTDPGVPTGEIYSGAAPLALLRGLTVRIGGKPAEVQFAGLSAAGLNQFNVVVPPDLSPGRYRIEMAVFTSPAITNATILVGER